MRNHFLSLPAGDHRGRAHGRRGPVRLLFRVMLPLSGPTMVAFAIITIVNEWNEYLWPFLMSDDSPVAPLPVGLTLLQNSEGYTNWGPVMAAHRAHDAADSSRLPRPAAPHDQGPHLRCGQGLTHLTRKRDTT